MLEHLPHSKICHSGLAAVTCTLAFRAVPTLAIGFLAHASTLNVVPCALWAEDNWKCPGCVCLGLATKDIQVLLSPIEQQIVSSCPCFTDRSTLYSIWDQQFGLGSYSQ